MHRRSTVAVAASALVVIAACGTTEPSPPASPGTSSPTPDRIVVTPAEDGLHVTWRTDVATTDGAVELREPDGDVRRIGADTSVVERLPGSRLEARHHTATLDPDPSSPVVYRVGGDDAWSGWHELAAADNTAPWTFLYFGDAQLGLDAGWARTVDAAFARHGDARVSLHAGDLVNDGNDDAQWQAWFDAMEPWAATRTILTTPGNHELLGDDALHRYRSQFAYPSALDGHGETVWSTDVGGVRFIGLDGNATGDEVAEQAAWLEDRLTDDPPEWTVVTFHQPMFAASKGRDNLHTRDAWLAVLEEHDVDLVLQGHDHAYARGHLAENETPEGVRGPVYVVANAGDKHYPLDPGARNNWTTHRAVRAAAADQVSTYQAITVESGRLVYRSYAGSVGPGATPGIAVGDLVDAFTITADNDGTLVTPGAPTLVP